MKKLIYITNIRMPTEKAHGIQIMKMCEAFATAGLKVELIVPWRFNKIKENPFDYYGVKKSFRIKKLPSLDLMPLGLPKIGFWIQNWSFAKPAFFYALFKKAEIIYTRDIPSLFLLGFFRKNLVYEAHTFPRHFYLYKELFRKIKATVAITKELKNLFVKNGIIPDKILVAPDGVDLDEFNIKESQEECRRTLSLSQDKKLILYTGHLYKWKGAQTLADASRYFKKDILVVFIGGTKKDEKKFRKTNQHLQNVLILGYKPHSIIPYYLKAADVLVLPNSAQEKISRDYTSPIKMFEYMAAQRPIIASDLPSIREILNENNAVLIKPDSPDDLARGIEQLLKKPDFSAKIAKRAYQDVQRYTWQKRTEKILDFIKWRQ